MNPDREKKIKELYQMAARVRKHGAKVIVEDDSSDTADDATGENLNKANLRKPEPNPSTDAA